MESLPLMECLEQVHFPKLQNGILVENGSQTRYLKFSA